MGLAISRSIIEVHGGRIWGAANSDRGLTVHIELPSSAVREAGKRGSGEASHPSEQSERGTHSEVPGPFV
jgi:hypothetical protein